jgi:hypothetical protein
MLAMGVELEREESCIVGMTGIRLWASRNAGDSARECSRMEGQEELKRNG